MPLFFYFFVSFLFVNTIFAGPQEDVTKIELISSFHECKNTLKNIIFEKIEHAQESSLKNASSAINDFIVALDSIDRSYEAYQNEGTFNSSFSYASWEIYPSFVRAYSLLDGNRSKNTSTFSINGYIQGSIDQNLIRQFTSEIARAKTIEFIEEDFDLNYFYSKGLRNSEEILNSESKYLMLEESQVKVLEQILASLEKPIFEALGMPWRVINIRIWETNPGEKKGGPFRWHLDGLPRSALKIMIYPHGANLEKGTTVLKLPQGDTYIEGGPGTWLLFRNSEIVHAGLTPKEGKRLIVEITIAPSLIQDTKPILAGLNARNPHLPWKYPVGTTHREYQKDEVHGINIGGGPNWYCPGWVNLEEVTSSINTNSFRLYPNCRFPMKNDSVNIIFTSHALEHLNMPTIDRVLSEAHRTLKQGKDFIIKIPDYDKALDCWRRNDASFFGSVWNIESVTPFWKNKNITDCLDQRASMIFCSFWNTSFGNPFDPKVKSTGQEPYFGPAALDISFLRDLIKDNTPFQIARILYRKIKDTEPDFHFCHQIAWSRKELEDLLNKHGFEVQSFDPKKIMHRFSDIPGMNEMIDISMFVWAKKR